MAQVTLLTFIRFLFLAALMSDCGSTTRSPKSLSSTMKTVRMGVRLCFRQRGRSALYARLRKLFGWLFGFWRLSTQSLNRPFTASLTEALTQEHSLTFQFHIIAWTGAI